MDELSRHSADWVAICDVVNRYAAAVDARDWERVANCFTEHGILKFPTRVLEGRKAIVEYLASAITWVDRQQHLIGSHQIAIDGDTATSSCALIATQIPVDPDAPRRTTVGTYYDRLVRTEDGWRIAHRELRVLAGW